MRGKIHRFDSSRKTVLSDVSIRKFRILIWAVKVFSETDYAH